MPFTAGMLQFMLSCLPGGVELIPSLAKREAIGACLAAGLIQTSDNIFYNLTDRGQKACAAAIASATPIPGSCPPGTEGK